MMTEAEVKWRLREWAADVVNLEALLDLMDADSGNGDAWDIKVARALQDAGALIEARVKERRYDAMIGVIGESKQIEDGVLFEVVPPTEYWSVNPAAVKARYPRLWPDGEVSPHDDLYRLRRRSGFVKVGFA